MCRIKAIYVIAAQKKSYTKTLKNIVTLTFDIMTLKIIGVLLIRFITTVPSLKTLR